MSVVLKMYLHVWIGITIENASIFCTKNMTHLIFLFFPINAKQFGLYFLYPPSLSCFFGWRIGQLYFLVMCFVHEELFKRWQLLLEFGHNCFWLRVKLEHHDWKCFDKNTFFFHYSGTYIYIYKIYVIMMSGTCCVCRAYNKIQIMLVTMFRVGFPINLVNWQTYISWLLKNHANYSLHQFTRTKIGSHVGVPPFYE